MSDNIEQEIPADKLRISEEVIETLAGVAVSEVGSVSSAGSGVANGIAVIIGKKTFAKGRKAEINGNDIKLEISLLVNYGTKIHVITRQIQDRVRETLEDSTGMKVSEVNIHVTGLVFDKEHRKEEAPEEASHT